MPSIKISNSPNYSELDIFLKQNRVGSNGTFTHTTISGLTGSYYIDETKIDKFHDIYNNHVFLKGLKAYLTEGIRDCQVTPIKIDLDFRKYKDVVEPERLYDMADIIKICQRYMGAMEEWLETPDPEERYCFILEKKNPVFDTARKTGDVKLNDKGEKRIKDGVHIMFPYICTKTFLQLEFRNNVYKNIGEILDKYDYDNSYADIFDRAVIDKNNWQMYGSTKSQTSYTYKVTKILEIYKDSYKEVDINKYNSLELVKLLSVRNKDQEALIKYEKQAIVIDSEEQYLKHNKYKLTNKSKTKKNKASKDDLRIICGRDKYGNEHKGYIDCLGLERAQNYQSWIEVGWALHNIDNRSDSGKATRQINESRDPNDKVCDLLVKWWKWSTQEGTGYENESIDTYKEYWDSMRYDGLALGSLKLWAKQDNPDIYEKIRDEDITSDVDMSSKSKTGASSYDIAMIMHKCYKDDFVCVSIKDTLWYYYDEEIHRWVEDDKGIRLKMKISTEMWKKFHNRSLYYSGKVEPGEAANKDTDDENRRDSCLKTCASLKKTNFKANIMTECAELFYDKSKTFYDKLDSNLNLLGFNNGVYDLKYDEFRKGRPEDFITLSTGIDYIDFDPYSDEIKGINKFLDEILTIPNVKKYVVKLMGTFISGSTKSEKFHVWSGSGGNGKSKLIELLEKAMGDYAGKMNISNLTQKRGNAGSANPELSRTRGRRFINMQEPDEHCKLNVGLMKELTGGDKIIARALYKEPQEFKPQFKMVLTCNDRPELPPDDEGTWRRVVLVEYKSRFKAEPHGKWISKTKQELTLEQHKENLNKSIFDDIWVPDDKINPQFPIDETLNEKFDDWAEPFMSMLINTYIKNKHIDLREPKEVTEYTAKYRDQNNHFKEFVNDKVIISPENEAVVKIEELFIEYKVWYKDNLGTSNGQKKQKDLKIFMDNEYGEYWVEGTSYTKRGYKGIKILSHKDPYEINDELN